jgi:hypothetical protein
MMKKILMLLSVVFVMACSSTKDAKTITYDVLTDSAYGGKKKQSFEVIDNHDDLRKLYKAVGDDLVPNIDFAKYRIVALFMGEKTSGGYTIGIENIRQEKGKVIIKIKKTYPDGMATMALSQPYMIAQVKTTKKIEFEE